MNARTAPGKATRAYKDACRPCREYNTTSTCGRLPGHQHYNDCEEAGDDCKYDQGTSLPNLPTSGIEVIEEDLHSWGKPMSLKLEVDLMLQIFRQLPPTDRIVYRFLVIGVARKSSHPGALTMAQVQQNLILTVNQHIQQHAQQPGIREYMGSSAAWWAAATYINAAYACSLCKAWCDACAHTCREPVEPEACCFCEPHRPHHAPK